MILFLRKNFHHKGIMQGLLLVTAISMIGIGSVPMLFKLFFNDSRTMFTVNGIRVARPELALRAYGEQQLLAFYRKQFGDLTSQVLAMQGLSLNPEMNAQEKIIRGLVLASVAERSGLSISLEGLLAQMRDPMAVMALLGPQLTQSLYSKQGILQKQALGALLQRVGLTIGDFEKMLGHEAEKLVVLDLARLAIPATTSEVSRQLVKDKAQRTYTITGYSLKPYIKSARSEEATPAELEEYFATANARDKRYWKQERRSGRVWSCALAQERVEECRKELLAALSDNDSFAQMVKKWKCDHRVLAGVALSDKHSAAPMLFRLELDGKGVFVDGSTVYVVMPTHVIAAQEQPLESVRTLVAEDFYREKAQRLASKDLDAGTLDSAHKISTETITLLPGKELDSSHATMLRRINVPVDRLRNMTNKDQDFKAVTQDAAYVVALTDIVMAEVTLAERFMARKMVREEVESSFLSAFIENLTKTAKIKSIQSMDLADIRE